MKVSVTVNGHAFEHDVEPRTLLVQLLREQCRLTGTKIGCDTSSCRHVHCALRTRRRHGRGQARVGEELHDARGPGRRRAHHHHRGPRRRATAAPPMQQAFHDHHGLQCGYCTAGMVLAAVGFLDENPRPSARCAARPRRQPLPLHRLPQHRAGGARHGRQGARMIPAKFDYVRADSTDAALAAIIEHGDEAKFLAGGMSLLPLMKLRLATPTVLVDVGRLRDLSYIRDGGDHITIGALTRRPRCRDQRPACPRLRGACGRGRRGGRQPGASPGTLGGSVAHGDPASDLTPVDDGPFPRITVSFSAGVADARPGEKREEVLARADKALYLAKRTGQAVAKVYNRQCGRLKRPTRNSLRAYGGSACPSSVVRSA